MRRRQVVRPKLPNQFHARFFRKLTKQTITKNQFKGVLFRHAFVFPSVRETGETRVFDELLTNVRILDPAGPCNRGFVCVRFVAASSLPAANHWRPPMSRCKVVAIANQKGGTGKTTTAASLGVALAMSGKRVLLIDADPQGDLTASLGWRNPDELGNHGWRPIWRRSPRRAAGTRCRDIEAPRGR